MRNLKRALSLTLASVMLLGMMIVGTSAASYPDVDDNDNVEAIEVLSAVGVIVGDNGNFKPDAPVTRNEMAVIMTKMLGLNANDFAGACPFTDVKPWAQNYVAACQANGIIAGRSATIFDGDATVNATEAAAMMMRALGYFKYPGDYEGGFVNATVRQAAQIRLFANVAGSANSPMNRNDVAQLALNTLEADMVDFTGTLGWEINGIAAGYQSKYDPRRDLNNTQNTGYNYTNDSGTTHQKEYLQLCEDLYDGKLKKITDTDDFGRPTSKWTYNGEAVYETAKVADYTFTSKVTGKSLSKAVTKKTIDDYSWELNGTGIADPDSTNDSAAIFNSGNGVLVQVYLKETTATVNGVTTTTKTAEVFSIPTYVAQVSANYNSSKGELTLKNVTNAVAVPVASSKLTLSSDDFSNLASFAKDDYVLVTTDGTDIKTIEKADVVTDTVTSYVAGKNVTAGSTYSYTKGYESQSITSAYNLNKEYKLVVDKYGYVIFAEGVAAAENYIYVTKDAPSGGVKGGYEIEFITPDGAVDVATVHTDSKGTGISGGNGSDVTGVIENEWYSYEVKSGKYVLTAVPTGSSNVGIAKNTVTVAANGTAANIVKNNQPTITYNGGTIAANDATTFIVKKGSTITVYNGVKNVPDINVLAGKSADVAIIKDRDALAYAKYVMIVAGKDAISASGSAAGERIFIVDATNVSHSKPSDDDLYTYEAVINGVEGKITSTSSTWKVGLYTDVAYDNGNVDNMNEVAVSSTHDTERKYNVTQSDISFEKSVLAFNGGSLVLSDSCKVFVSDGDKLTDVTTAQALADKYEPTNKFNGSIYAILDNKQVIELYVVDSTAKVKNFRTDLKPGEIVVGDAAALAAMDPTKNDYAAGTNVVFKAKAAANADKVVLKIGANKAANGDLYTEWTTPGNTNEFWFYVNLAGLNGQSNNNTIGTDPAGKTGTWEMTSATAAGTAATAGTTYYWEIVTYQDGTAAGDTVLYSGTFTA